jgi:hypothetical protein
LETSVEQPEDITAFRYGLSAGALFGDGRAEKQTRCSRCAPRDITIRIPLEEQAVEVTTHAAGTYFVLGWHELPNRGLYPDGTYILPTAVFTAPTGPIGFRVNAAGLSIALECMLGGDNGWTRLGPRVVRDDLLLRYPIPDP